MKKDRGRKTPFNPFEGPQDPEALAREMLGRHYRFRRADRRLSPSDALDILQSLHFVLATEPERLARLSAWSEAGEDTGRSLVANLQGALESPAVGIVPTLWESEIRLAAEANTAAFAEHPLDPALITTSGGVAARPELWLDAEPARYLAVRGIGMEEETDEARLTQIHDTWWELPRVGQYAPLGLLLLPATSPVPVRTFRGYNVAAGTPGLLAVALFAPFTHQAGHEAIPIQFDAVTGEPTGPTLILRAMEICWAGLPVTPFYAPLVAMRWFLGERFIESGEAPVPPEKRREVGALMGRVGGVGDVGQPAAVRYVRFRRTEGAGQDEASGTGGESHYRGWWWVQGHVRRIRDAASGGTRPVWVKGYPKGPRGEGQPYVGRGEVRRVNR